MDTAQHISIENVYFSVGFTPIEPTESFEFALSQGVMITMRRNRKTKEIRSPET